MALQPNPLGGGAALASAPARPGPAASPDAGLPEGYVAVPVSAAQADAPLRLCALVRRQPDPLGGRLVLLRDTADARVFLGAVRDAGGRVHRWVELWVQSIEGLANTLPAWRQALSNAAMDERWRRHAEGFEALEPDALIRTGWEARHPPPVWLDLTDRRPVHPADPTGRTWRLCEDEAALAAAGLPPYGTTLHRYLYVPPLDEPGGGGPSAFVPITPGSPTNANTRDAKQAIPNVQGPDLVPLNPGGGLMMVRAFSPVTLESFLDLLTGATPAPLLHGRSPLRLDDATVGAEDPAADAGPLSPEGGTDKLARADDGWLFLGPHGRWGRLLESFHLKLRLLSDALGAVRTLTQLTQRPMLNIGPDQFRVALVPPSAGVGLPYLWTAKAVLAGPGDAIELPIRASDARFFLPGRDIKTSVYSPTAVSQADQAAGACMVRIRGVLTDGGAAGAAAANPAAGTGGKGGTVLEGTFTTQERIEAGPNDLVRLRVPLEAGPVDLHARLDAAAGLAVGEWRFRTIGQRFDEAVVRQLRAAEGVRLDNSSFELVPLLSSPCDLYSLAVLAVRALLVNPQTTLAMAVDELTSLARQVAHDHSKTDQSSREAGLRLRLRVVFERDPRWMQSLGPHRLAWEPIQPQQALDLVPWDLWCDVLSMLVRMLPGVGPDSACADLGAARPGALHRVYDATTADLDELLVRTRSLLVIDWRYNREVHGVLRRMLTGVTGTGGGGGAPTSAQEHAMSAPAGGAVPPPPPRKPVAPNPRGR